MGETEPGTREAAILIVLLGHEVGGKLLQQMPADQASAIISEVATIDEIEPSVAQNVLETYFEIAVRPERPRGGPETAQQLLKSADLPEALAGDILVEEPESTASFLRPLLEPPPDVLSEVLAGEHPQTSALVLLNLGAEKAASVFATMPEEVRTQVLSRMTTLRQVRPEILEEVASCLGDRLQQPVSTASAKDDGGGIERTAEILQMMGRAEVRSLLEALEAEDPERAAKLRELVFTFDSLSLADDRGIQALLRMVETKTIALALQGVEQSLADHFLNNLSERAASMLREEMEFLGTVRPADQEAAQKEITQQALELEKQEQLAFSDPQSDE
ncbi:MAG: hypothetical protein GY716_08590 [bacterium]|nr:hypothetical protein [bacterium]